MLSSPHRSQPCNPPCPAMVPLQSPYLTIALPCHTLPRHAVESEPTPPMHMPHPYSTMPHTALPGVPCRATPELASPRNQLTKPYLGVSPHPAPNYMPTPPPTWPADHAFPAPRIPYLAVPYRTTLPHLTMPIPCRLRPDHASAVPCH